MKYKDLENEFAESAMVAENEYYAGAGQKLRACRYCYLQITTRFQRAEHDFYQDSQTDKYIDVIRYTVYKDDDEYRISHLWYWSSYTATAYDSYKVLIKKVG